MAVGAGKQTEAGPKRHEDKTLRITDRRSWHANAKESAYLSPAQLD